MIVVLRKKDSSLLCLNSYFQAMYSCTQLANDKLITSKKDKTNLKTLVRKPAITYFSSPNANPFKSPRKNINRPFLLFGRGGILEPIRARSDIFSPFVFCTQRKGFVVNGCHPGSLATLSGLRNSLRLEADWSLYVCAMWFL